MTARRLYYWVHHTGRYPGNSGVQRVVRGLGAALAGSDGCRVVPVRWCAEREAILHAEEPWLRGLAGFGGPALAPDAAAGEPLHLAPDAAALQGAWLLLPEVPHVAQEGAPVLPVALDYARFHGLRTAAVFYDLIPLRVPGYEAMTGEHARYARALVGTDLVLGISRDATRDLSAWWAEGGYDPRDLPDTRPVPLPEAMPGTARGSAGEEPPAPPVRFLALGTVEPRKNQLAAMRAVRRLRARRPELGVELDVVGSIHPAVAAEAEAIVAQEPGGAIRLHRYLPDAEVEALVRRCHATVFVSLAEGFGLPVAESLWLGRPCLCSDRGSVAEIAEGGGCLAVDPRDGAAIERGLERLAEDPELRRRLAREAAARPARGWGEYGRDVLGALAATPPLRRVALVEGSRRGGGEEAAALSRAGAAAVRRLHWHPASRALLPGSREAPETPRPGDGQLHDLWALLPAATAADAEEAATILAEAQGLGLRVALLPEAGRQPDLRAAGAADLTLFGSEAERDAALALALRDLPRTATLRQRFRAIGAAGGLLAAIAEDRPRLTRAAEPQVPRRLYYWAGLTASQPFNTGVQRVTRLLAASLARAGIEVVPVTWDPAEGRMAPLSAEETEHLARWNGPVLPAPGPLPADLRGEWLLLPEITVPVVPPESNPTRLGRRLGMRVAAIFYDLIPEKMAENYAPETLRELHAYWRGFAEADLALPISWTVAADLRRFLAARGLPLPRIVPCPLAGDAGTAARRPAAANDAVPAPGDPLRLLAVGTWEPRKNYPRLLRALKAAQAASPRPISLVVVGRRAGFDELDAEILHLATEAGVTLRDHVTDEELQRLHDGAHATVFASWEEGFGLPVLESLWRGLPCLCHDGSALREVAPGGGVLAVDMLDEAAIAAAIARLAGDGGALLSRLSREALERPIRSWDEYAADVTLALARAGAAPGWPLPAVVGAARGGRRPLLSCSITTYNRAPWLAHSLPRLLEATRPWRDVVEVVVCDNASTDATPEVVARFRGEAGFSAHRNSANVGMLGNLGATARASSGAFVWLLGDDDLLTEGAVENVLEGLAAHPEVEMAYVNYAYTHFDEPERLADAAEVIRAATPIAEGGPNRRVAALREVAALNENLFTAIYACAFRRDHALRAYQLDTRGPPFSSLATCVPSSVYTLNALADRPAWWVGEPAVVVNMNVSWLRWRLLWHLERMPDLYDLGERAGLDRDRLDRYRLQHLAEAERWVRAAYFEAEDAVRTGFSMARLLERSKHLAEFRATHLPALRRVYAEAWAAGHVAADPVPPEELFARYGLVG